MQVTRTCIKSQRSLNSIQIRIITLELLALSAKKAIFDLDRLIVPSVLIGSSSNLQVTRT